jgi:hypothetical protein
MKIVTWTDMFDLIIYLRNYYILCNMNEKFCYQCSTVSAVTLYKQKKLDSIKWLCITSTG